MLDALVNFAAVDVALMVIVAVIGVYAAVRLTARARTTPAQVDAHMQEQLAAIDRDRAEASESMDIHSMV